MLVAYSWLLCLSICQGYRLLGVFPYYSASHFVIAERLMKGLADKGHQVDMISHFPLKMSHPNYTDIVKLKWPIQIVNNLTFESVQYINTSLTHFTATSAGNDICQFLGKPEIQKLVRDPPKDPPYDAILMEVY